MKGRVKNIIMASFFAAMLVFITGGFALAEYHHVDNCMVCHDMYGGGDCGDYTNLRLIYCDLSTPNSGIKTVRFTCDFSRKSLCDPEGTNSYADGDAIYDGVCEVCHTQTKYHRNDGSGEPHYAGHYCITCHPHSDEFSHAGGASVGCESCHGHDAGYEYAPGQFSQGAGTYQSHSTHTENDSDDLKGPNIACGACHDTNNFPYFLSGTDSNGSHKYELSETDVCDNCHSQGGAFDGVAMAQANWDAGIYETNSTTLKSGKEQWCASCHDDAPAFSKLQPIEIVVDNQDAGASFAGSWDTSTYSPGYYGTNYHYHIQGTGSDTFRWTPTVPTPGIYTVYARWTADPSRAPDTTYTISHDGGNTPVVVDQRSNGGTWVFLSTYCFDGVNDYVELNDSPNGYVIADAIKWESGSPGTYAPNVVGDTVTYGFYVTGHKINCLSCHEGAKNHIDSEHRTYEAGVIPYSNSYRLKDISGLPAMNIPRPLYSAGTNPLDHWDDFALCFSCHNRNEVLSKNPATVDKTNFWNNDASPGNSHNIHLGIYSIHFDSDWDGVADSSESCIACHNVHGAPNQAMIRHGELISTPGSTDKVPALNFAYLVAPDTPDPNATLLQSLGGKMSYAGAAISQNHVCSACHQAVSYERAPNVKPRILMPQAEPFSVDNNGTDQVLLTAYIYNPAGTVSSVTIDLSLIEGNAAQAMYDDGTHGDVTSGDMIYSFQSTVPVTVSTGLKALTIIATNSYDTGSADVELMVANPGWVAMDNKEADFVGYWGVSTWEGAGNYYETDYSYRVAGTGTSTATFAPSLPQAGNYNVYAWWTAYSNRSANAPYTINYSGGSDTVMVDQKINGSQFVLLGTYYFDAQTGHTSVIVDNEEAEFVGNWAEALSGIYYGINYQYHEAGAGTDTATFTPNLPQAGNYDVFAWWTESSNRATNAPYTINYSGGSDTVLIDQEQGGGGWIYLGTYAFEAGTSGSVVLSDNANEYVIADAIKFQLSETKQNVALSDAADGYVIGDAIMFEPVP